MIDIYINIVLESNLLVPLYRDTLFSQKYEKKKWKIKRLTLISLEIIPESEKIVTFAL